MPTDIANRRYRFAFVLILLLAVLALFLAVIRAFVLDIALAAIFAGVLEPLNKRAVHLCNGRRGTAAVLVVLFSFLAFALPLIAIGGLVGIQAGQLTEATAHWVQYIMDHPTRVARFIPDWLASDTMVRETIKSFTSGASGLVRALSIFLSKNISAVTQGAISFFIDLFVFFYAMFYFVRRGPEIVDTVLDHIPLAKDEGYAVAGKILVAASATLKSVVIIGLIQGALMGIVFTVVGIDQPLFWAAVTTVVSAIPALGPKIVWIPAAIYLFVTGQTAFAIGLIVWGLAVIDMVDNVVRPFIVGRDAAIPDYLVLVSTLGGLMMFGVPGIILGPVLASIMLAMFELYQSVMRSTGLSNNAE